MNEQAHQRSLRRSRTAPRAAVVILAASWAAMAGPQRYDWVGDSGAGEHGEPSPRTVTGCWVDRDGTAYLVAPPLHGEPSFSAFRQGVRIHTPPIPGGFTIAGNRTRLFIADVDGIRMIPKPGAAPGESLEERRIAVEGVIDSAVVRERFPDRQVVRGMLASERHLLVSNAARQRIELWSLEGPRKLRTMDFERPGAMALDAYQGLWVVREPPPGADGGRPPDPAAWAPPARGGATAAALVRIDTKDGSVLEELPFAGIPTALLAVPRGEQGIPDLWVADNGPAQQILVYSRRDSRRTRLLRRIGGPRSSASRADDRETGPAFSGLVGLGRALDGTLQVAQNWSPGLPRRADVPPRGSALLGLSADLRESLWDVQQVAGDRPVAVASTPPHRLYYHDAVVEVDWAAADGLPWRTVGSVSDPFTVPENPAFRAMPLERSVHDVFDRPALFEIEGPSAALWRLDPARHGAVWLPFAAFHADASWIPMRGPLAAVPRRFDAAVRRDFETERRLRSDRQQIAALERQMQQRLELQRSFGWIWTDGSGAQPTDGQFQDDEVESLGARYRDACWSVADNGTLWLAGRETGPFAVHRRPRLRCWTPERLNSAGLPVYRPHPQRTAPWPLAEGRILWMHHRPDTRQMLLGGATPRHPGRQPRWIGVYHDWPETDALGTAVPRLANILLPAWGGAAADALSAAGPLVFVLDAAARTVRAFDTERGNLVATLDLAPALGPPDGPQAPPRTLTARMLENGHALVLGAPEWGRTLVVRWNPEPARQPLPRPDLRGWIDDQRVRLLWTTPDCGLIEGYHVERQAPGDAAWRRLTTAPQGAAFLDDTHLDNGESYAYRVAIAGAGGLGPFSEPLRLVPAAPRVRFAGEDRQTQGDWQGRYGSRGWTLFGDAACATTPNPKLPAPMLRAALTDLPGVHPARPDLRADPALPLRPGADPLLRPAGYLRVSEERTVSIPIEIQDGGSLRLSLYAGSSERIHGVRVEMLNATATQVLDAREFTNEDEPHVRGRYWSWDVGGSVLLRITPPRQSEPPDQCGVNAIFFD